MKSLSLVRQLSLRGLWPLLCVALWFGCKREDSRVYYVPKEEPRPSAEPAPPTGGDMAAQPTLVWSLPDGWREKPPGEMRVASFTVTDQDGQSADVSVIPLPALAGRELENVNRWRGQVGLSPITQDELGSQTEKVEIAGSPASLFDMAGVAGDGSKKTRILAAMLDRDGMTWFFKMMGDDQIVGQQKDAFIKFIQSVRYSNAR